MFRDQKLPPPEYMKAAQIWGEIMPQMLERFTLPEYPLVGFVSSEDTDKPGGKRMVRGEQYHTDHSNYPAPPKATLLHAVTHPAHGRRHAVRQRARQLRGSCRRNKKQRSTA